MKQLIYINIQEKKEIILKELKNKAGIYLFINNVNGKRYIG